MKIVVYGPDRRVGILRDDTVVDASHAYANYLHHFGGEPHALELAEALVPSDLERFIEGGKRVLNHAQAALDYLFDKPESRRGYRGETLVHRLSDVQLLAPRTPRSRIACAGGNFSDHAEAMAANLHTAYSGNARAQMREAGIWGFWKVDRETVPPDGAVIYPARTQRLDYEGEVAIVIGRKAKDVRAADAASYIWGVTLMGDWSARGTRESAGPHKFVMGKNFDTSCSLGPCIAVGEADSGNIDIETFVNGERRQSYNTRIMVFSFGEFIEFLTRDMTLYPGDIIAGGTAAGTAADSSPKLADGSLAPERFLKAGDRVEIRSPQIGSLRASIVAKELS